MSYYFAYGSNMDAAQMHERCPNARLLGKASLPGYMLDFRIYSPKRESGCADIVLVPGEVVWGLLYDVTEKDITSLDTYEGVPQSYRRIRVRVIDALGKKYKADAYEVVQKSPFQKPSQEYLGLLITAAREFSFPDAYIKRLSSIETR